jgi:hypothetical protein
VPTSQPISRPKDGVMLTRTPLRLLSAPLVGGLVVAMLLAAPAPAEAQMENDFFSGMQTGFGYAGAFPDLLFGGGVFHIFRPGGFGAMLDFKMNHETMKGDRAFTDAFTARDVPEELGFDYALTARFNEWMITNVGIMRPLTEDFAIFAGVAVAYMERIDEYQMFGDDEEGGAGDVVMVVNEENSRWTSGYFGGAFLRLGQNVVVRFGYEERPSQVGIGAYWVLSR